jgi:hypothetical protein
MKRFVEGDDRKQVALLPECVERKMVRQRIEFLQRADARNANMRTCLIPDLAWSGLTVLMLHCPAAILTKGFGVSSATLV